MTTTKVPELRIRRVLYAPQDMIEKLHIQNDCKRKEAPAMLRRAYEFSVSCGKDGEDDARAPLFFHIRGERSTPLLRCLVIGAAVVGEMLALEILDTWLGTEFSHDPRHQRRIDKLMALEK